MTTHPKIALPPFDVHLDADRGIAAITPRIPTCRTVLAFMGYRAWLDPFELQRFGLIAHETESVVVVPDYPGFGTSHARLNVHEVANLLAGNFQPLARRGVSQASPWIQANRPLHVVGYSMGASVAAAALPPLLGHIRPFSLTLIEPVATHRWTPRQLLRAIAAEDAAVDDALRDNRRWDTDVEPWDRMPGAEPRGMNRLTLSAMGFGITRGRIPLDLTVALQAAEDPVPVTVVRGSESLVSTSTGCRGLVQTVARGGSPANSLTIPGRHALWHSLSDVRAMTHLLVPHWMDAEVV